MDSNDGCMKYTLVDEWQRKGKSLDTKLLSGRFCRHSVCGLAIKEESSVRMLLVDAVNSSSSSSESHSVSSKVSTFSSGKKLTSVSARGTNAAAATALTYQFHHLITIIFTLILFQLDRKPCTNIIDSVFKTGVKTRVD